MGVIHCDCSVDVDEVALCGQEVIRTARKPHVCCECGETIPVGKKYEEATGIDPDHNPYRYHTCLPCSGIRRDYCSNGWIWGGLAEQIQECLGFDYRLRPSEWNDEDEGEST